MNGKPIRVMCVDDNQLVAEAIELRIRFEPSIEWAGWVSMTADLVERVLSAQPDIVLLDIDMPGRDAFELLRDLAEAAPNVRTVMFSGYVRSDYIDRAVEAGAWGYISKNESIQDLLAAIQQVADGEFALSHEVAAQQCLKR